MFLQNILCFNKNFFFQCSTVIKYLSLCNSNEADIITEVAFEVVL